MMKQDIDGSSGHRPKAHAGCKNFHVAQFRSKGFAVKMQIGDTADPAVIVMQPGLAEVGILAIIAV